MNNTDKNKFGEVVFNRAIISLPTQNTIFEKNSNFVIHEKTISSSVDISTREGMFSIFNLPKLLTYVQTFLYLVCNFMP